MRFLACYKGVGKASLNLLIMCVTSLRIKVVPKAQLTFFP